MLTKKTMATAVTATVLTGSVLGLGMVSFSAPAQAASQSAAASETTHPRAAEILNELYNTAFKGEMPQDIEGLKLNKSTQSDVYNKIGEPEKKADAGDPFDLYSSNMGNPGYGFSYNKDNTISQIRYFGTGVERQQNLGGITPAVLSKQIGSADQILTVPHTHEIDYVYFTGDYELHFVIGSDQTADHVNLKAR
ncbi:YjgB family protein [Bacillus atrophaeus]|uniref:YjgB family protein n=1 Tax=Bacillus atrophaeus TaxID=1452 RepID=UPI003872BCBC